MSNKDQWHLSKSVSIGHLVVTTLAVASAFMYLSDIKENVALNSLAIQNIKESNTSMFARIDKNVDKLSVKMDRIFEFMHKGE